MSELAQIKEEIYNCGLVVPLLESLGCEINPHSMNKDRIEASLPDGDNNRSVQVYLNEFLTARIRSRSHVQIRDIYDIVSFIKYEKESEDELNRCIGKSKRYIIKTLNLTQFENGNQRNQDDPNAWLKEIQRRRKKRINLDEIEPNPVLPESVLDGFVMTPHQLWIEDDISWEVQREFEIGYDIQSERIIFPVRNIDGDIVGVKGRTTKKEDENQYKYLPLYSFQKSKELYNLYKAAPYIREKSKVILVEAEKSVMKLWGFDCKNVISQMGSDITKIQAEIIKRISPEIEVILAFDKDKTAHEVKQYAQVFGDYKNIYGIIDTKGLLELKDSPCDKGLDTWKELYNNHCYPIFPERLRR